MYAPHMLMAIQAPLIMWNNFNVHFPTALPLYLKSYQNEVLIEKNPLYTQNLAGRRKLVKTCQFD